MVGHSCLPQVKEGEKEETEVQLPPAGMPLLTPGPPTSPTSEGSPPVAPCCGPVGDTEASICRKSAAKSPKHTAPGRSLLSDARTETVPGELCRLCSLPRTLLLQVRGGSSSCHYGCIQARREKGMPWLTGRTRKDRSLLLLARGPVLVLGPCGN